MSRDIDWQEYERRKAKIQNVGLKSDEYDRAIAQILEDLDSESDEVAA
jgi:hypothetical protein